MLVNTGLQNKLLEAMALERACVTTERALSALGTDTPECILTAEDASSFAQAIHRLLESKTGLQTRGKLSRELVVSEFSWKAATATLVAQLQQEGRKG